MIANSTNRTEEYTRLFHGRGNHYGAWNFLTVDSIGAVLYAAFYAASEEEKTLVAMLSELAAGGSWQAFVLQRRYLQGAPSELLFGELPQEQIGVEDGLKYRLNFLANQNIGLFPDMKNGRRFVRENARGKKVLNLFSYTCAFSVAAVAGGAESVVNVDMSKSALTTGRENHRINEFDGKRSQYLPYNILKSWSRIRKAGPYEMIIIDPPSFQKGSFAATKDYEKIIRRLGELAAEKCTVLSALNSPELGTAFIKTLFKENAPEFAFVKRLDNMESFPSDDDERSLKNLIFQKGEV
ncbi:class I SAM-dependent methyltransferase [bacterium]|nr:class I SAM-dependent methyltransferase [bacterium]